MKTYVIKKGTTVSVRYEYATKHIDFSTGWEVPNEFWCSDHEISSEYTHFELVQEDILEFFSHIKWLVSLAVAHYGSPEVPHIINIFADSPKIANFSFFEDYHAYLHERFSGSSTEEFSLYVELREYLISYELYTRTPVDPYIFYLAGNEDFINYLFYIEKAEPDKIRKLTKILDTVMEDLYTEE
jgi:hypothetical protein